MLCWTYISFYLPIYNNLLDLWFISYKHYSETICNGSSIEVLNFIIWLLRDYSNSLMYKNKTLSIIIAYYAYCQVYQITC